MSCHDKQKEVIRSHKDFDPLIDNQLWSYTRLSKYLDVPIPTIRDWVYKRLVSFVKVGRHVRFKPSDIQQWLIERTFSDEHP